MKNAVAMITDLNSTCRVVRISGVAEYEKNIQRNAHREKVIVALEYRDLGLKDQEDCS